MKISKKLTSKESFAILREIENRKCPDGVSIPNGEKRGTGNGRKPSEI